MAGLCDAAGEQRGAEGYLLEMLAWINWGLADAVLLLN
jgi:hypothetical protein